MRSNALIETKNFRAKNFKIFSFFCVAAYGGTIHSSTAHKPLTVKLFRNFFFLNLSYLTRSLIWYPIWPTRITPWCESLRSKRTGCRFWKNLLENYISNHHNSTFFEEGWMRRVKRGVTFYSTTRPVLITWWPMIGDRVWLQVSRGGRAPSYPIGEGRLMAQIVRLDEPDNLRQ